MSQPPDGEDVFLYAHALIIVTRRTVCYITCMSMEFTEQDVAIWPQGSQIAEVYERACTVARQLPCYSVRFLAVTSNPEQLEVAFSLKFIMNPRVVNRVRRDIGTLAARSLPDVSVAIENQTAENSTSDCYTGALPPMHDKTWEMLQEHWEEVRAFNLPFRSIRTFLHDPQLSRIVTGYDSPYPSLSTRAEAAFTTVEEKITLYEQVQATD